MILTSEEARNVVYEDHEDWELVPGTESIISHSRWRVGYTGVFQHKPAGKFYRFNWSVGATECQDQQAYEYVEEYKPVEVHWVKKLVDVWEESE
jgi:hypothetical protein